MAKKKRAGAPPSATPSPMKPLGDAIPRPGLLAAGLYLVIAAVLTYPLIFRMNSSVYGMYDHISTDLFAGINYYFWWMKKAVLDLHTSPFFNPLFAAPFGQRQVFSNFTGFAQLPVTILFGHVFSRNSVILFNLVMSGTGMFLLVRHITGNIPASFIAGIIFAFCPNMMVRSYTTFDSTQVAWLPFYLLAILRFVDDRSWKNAILIGVFLVCNMLFAMAYYFVYLPVQTVAVMAALAVWRMTAGKRGLSGLVRDLTSPDALRAWGRLAAVLAVVIVIFGAYYVTVLGGTRTMSAIQRTTAQLEELSLAPTDYLVPHPRSTLFKGNVKASYWDAKRPGRDPDSFVAYIGYIALALAVLGVARGRRREVTVLAVCGFVAFWATLGPTVLGLPSPSGLIHTLYAGFARRVLIYKVFVQLSVAALAGIGAAWLFGRLRSRTGEAALLAGLSIALLAEYAIVPPALSVDLSENPEVYERVRDLPDGTILMEVPLRRTNGNLYQGYIYYQTVHGKPLFNWNMWTTHIPGRIQPFYRQMEVPMEAQQYANLAALRYLGVTHMTYHYHIGTRRVIFRAFEAPGFAGDIEGLSPVFRNERPLDDPGFTSPYDYTFADLYEITAEPCPVALVYDYVSPYDQVPGLLTQDGMLRVGWASALVDGSAAFSIPLADSTGNLVRLMRREGRITAVNLSDAPAVFDLTFNASAADGERTLTVTADGAEAVFFTIGGDPVRCNAGPFTIPAGGELLITLDAGDTPFTYDYDFGGGTVGLPAHAVLSDTRVLPR